MVVRTRSSVVVRVFAGICLLISSVHSQQTADYVASDSGHTTDFEITNWAIFSDTLAGYEFQYPADLISITDSSGVLYLTHSIPYDHLDPCDESDDVHQLSHLTDFRVMVWIVAESIENAIAHNTYLTDELPADVELDSLESTMIGGLFGVRTFAGSHECGHYTHYFEMAEDTTLIVRRFLITALKPTVTISVQCLQLPGVIQPDEEERLFSEIFKNFRWLR